MSFSSQSLLTRMLLAGALVGSPLALHAQSAPQGFAFTTAEEGRTGGAATAEAELESEALRRGRYAVVIDLDENRLHFRKGEITLWSAPIGTGTGLRMKSGKRAWDFSTPNGVFHIKYKELNPVWIAPDWYFVENGLPVPPPNDRKRYFEGGLGAAAVYLEHDLAIHGTDKPELLGQRVSHGCIRLANEYALRLFHNVQVGTEVIIVGGEDAPRQEVTAEEVRRKAAATFSPGRKKPAPKDPIREGWKKMSTEDLLGELESELWIEDEGTRWPEVAGLLLERAIAGDDELALAGILTAVLDLPSSRVEREYETFLADAFSRGSLRTLETLSRLGRWQRERVAQAMVRGVMELYHGEFDSPSAPWPTRRVPESAATREGRRGWQALREAEAAFGTGAVRRTI